MDQRYRRLERLAKADAQHQLELFDCRLKGCEPYVISARRLPSSTSL